MPNSNQSEIDAVIRAGQVCRLAMAADNEPYLLPLSFGYDGKGLYIHTAKSGRKIDFMRANSRVCFEFEQDVLLKRKGDNPCGWSFSFQTVVGHGTIAELTDDDEKRRGLEHIVRQYADPDSASQYSKLDTDFSKKMLDRLCVWRIEIESATVRKHLR